MNWKKRIERAEVKGKFSRTAKELVESWPSCAVGEKFANEGVTQEVSSFIWGDEGDELRKLGLNFCRAVNGDKIQVAKRLYKKIQKVELYV